MVEILTELATETDYYQMNEFEMSLLTGEKLDALRNNRRVSKTKNRRWDFIKGEGNKSNNSKITYPLGNVRQKLEMSIFFFFKEKSIWKITFLLTREILSNVLSVIRL